MLTIEVQRSDATQAMTTLKTAFRSNPRGWVALKMCYVNPTAFASALSEYVLRKYLCLSTDPYHCRPDHSLVRATMYQAHRNQSHNNYRSHRHKEYLRHRRYNAMVHKDDFKKVREYLNTNLQQLVSTYIPEDIPSHPDGPPSVMMTRVEMNCISL